MMSVRVSFPGYQITETLYDGSRTVVYRAVRNNDSLPLVIKLLKNPHPSLSELAQFQNQYSITKNLNYSGIIQTYSLESCQNGYMVVMEDFGGVALSHYYQTQVPQLEDFLQIAISLCDILNFLYHQRIIHKDIKPGNILINPTTKQIKLIDFSIASLLPRETQSLKSPNVLEGTLAYISPEQTGRMNRAIDYRTDFYSLGVTFYELLTGKLPFSSTEAMELIHCHIAKKPNSLEKTGNNEEIPQVIADIIMKLMAKNAEDRYQSALGLKHDLENCLHQIKDTGKLTYFQIAEKDICDRFIIPDKLYGRKSEVEALLAAFDRVSGNITNQSIKNQSITHQPKSEIMLVTGLSGIGKTAVVNEIHKPIVRQKGYFIKGKFDQFNRNIPFSAFVQAFRDLIRHLLTESDARIQAWKSKILDALGENGQIIIEVIPELEKIIGQQPTVAELSGVATQNRFNLLFTKFLQVFTAPSHPLVIFLDDLQWADSASLKLIQTLMGESETSYLFTIGAYRDNEVFPGHPLILMLKDIEEKGAIITTITLKALSKNSLDDLVGDTLNCQTKLAQPLAELIYQKTQGNPFFSTQFLKALHQDGLISFDNQSGWLCDITEIRKLALTDNVIEFMTEQLQKFPLETQEILKLAACIGNQFDLNTLAIISEKSTIATATDLWTALEAGLILPQTDIYKFYHGDNNEQSQNLTSTDTQLVEYKFLHDRVQQAAYLLIPESQKQKTHWQIGQALLTKLSSEELEDKLFAVVNQLNKGLAACGDDKIIQAEIANLNLRAGQKAKDSIAYAAAINYFNQGINLLSADCWEQQYRLSFDLHRQLAEAEYLNSNFERAESLVADLLTKAKSEVEQADLYNFLVIQYTLEGKYERAITSGLQGLKLLGIEIPTDNLEIAVEQRLQKVKEELQGQEVADIIHKPLMTRYDKKIAAKLLQNIDAPTYITGQMHLFAVVASEAILLFCRYGNAPASPKIYTNYGFVLELFLEDYSTACEFGITAYKLSQIMQNKEQQCKSSFVLVCWLYSWNQPLQNARQISINGYQAGLESGELLFAGYHLFGRVCIRHFQGTQLEQLLQEISDALPFIEKTKNHLAQEILLGVQFAIAQLIKSLNPAYTWSFQKCPIPFPLAIYHTYQCQVFYLLNQTEAALEHVHKIEEYLPTIKGFITSGEYHFYAPLVLLDCLSSLQEDMQERYWEKINQHLQKLKTWSQDCPQNFQHKYLLVQAEIERVKQDFVNALQNYELAISGAKENGFIQEQALANELAAKFYLDWGKEKVAQGYMQEAYYCYSTWGATAKVAQLEQNYPQLLAAILLTSNFPMTNKGNTTSTQTQKKISTTGVSHSQKQCLDWNAVMKAAQTISQEIELEKLLATLMQTLITSTGAQTGYLILRIQGKWFVVIEANSEQTKMLEIALEDYLALPRSLVYSVARTQETEVFANLSQAAQFLGDSYIIKNQPKSALCSPISQQGELVGILYLENNLTIDAFTSDRLQIIQLLTTQAAISLKNAQLYRQLESYSQQLEQKVDERTQELSQKATQLESTLQELQRTQMRLVQSEKMSSLGQLVAGIAHEINNPVNFIHGNINYIKDYTQDLLSIVNNYQRFIPNQVSIEEILNGIDLDFIQEDLPKTLQSMAVGTQRIREIVLSLRTFSRMDEAEIKEVDIHEGIDSTLMILQHRLKETSERCRIEVLKNYAQLPLIECYAGQLNQVFMNILSNAIDSIEEKFRIFNNEQSSQIKICTSVVDTNSIEITIADSGMGMSSEVQKQMFNPFFTTKAVGKGTGMGMSISYQIIIEKHGGTLNCISTSNEGSEFIIRIPICQKVRK